MPTRIIGIDCAVDDTRVGLALATFDGSSTLLERVALGSRPVPVVGTVQAWLSGADRALIALDAPLGWPAALAAALPRHTAGAPLHPAAHSLFRRETDVVVKRATGKQSLDVGADRIARTAHAALGLLQSLRELTHEPIPLAWSPAFEQSICAIEVYPAATLASYGVIARGYKQSDGTAERRAIVEFLERHMRVEVALDALVSTDHAVDAALCCLAGLDFLCGNAQGPTDAARARKEGWIWFRRTAAGVAPAQRRRAGST